MDFEKLEKISIELFKSNIVNLQPQCLNLSMLVYKDIYTIKEAKEVIEYTYSEHMRKLKR